MATISGATARATVSPIRSIVIAGLVIGVIGGIDQTTFFVLTQHFTPMSIFQYIASALLGPSAFAGGYMTALLGLLLHFLISFVVAAVFILAANQFAFLRRTVFVSALIYGAAVNMFMSVAVLPFTAAPKIPVSTLLIVHGLVADALVIGLPLAITVWQSSRANKGVAAA